MKRVNDHLTGHGCRDVYRDYKNGDKFYIHTIPFKGSGYRSLNALERDNIAKYSGLNGLSKEHRTHWQQ